MKNKNIFLFLLIFCSTNAQAVSLDLNCKRPVGLEGFTGGTHFYNTFLSVSDKISSANTYLYQAVDDHVELKLKKVCKLNMSREKKLSALGKTCFKACALEVSEFHNELVKTKVFKKNKIKRQTKDCQSVCHYSQRLQQEGYDETALGVFGNAARTLLAE